MSAFSPALCRVEVFSSCVLNTNLDHTWSIARDFGRAKWLDKSSKFGFSINAKSASSGTEVGSTRAFGVGPARLFEQLTALDDLEHRLQWAVITHPETISPFDQASFLNYTATLQLRPVTVGRHTYVEWKGHFLTEPQYAQQMQNTMDQWYLAGFESLQDCVVKQQSRVKSRNSQPSESLHAHPQHVASEMLHGHMAPVQSQMHTSRNPKEIVMDAYLVDDMRFSGTQSQPRGAPPPAGDSNLDQAMPLPSPLAFQAAQSALHTGGSGSRRRRTAQSMPQNMSRPLSGQPLQTKSASFQSYASTASRSNYSSGHSNSNASLANLDGARLTSGSHPSSDHSDAQSQDCGLMSIESTHTNEELELQRERLRQSVSESPRHVDRTKLAASSGMANRISIGAPVSSRERSSLYDGRQNLAGLAKRESASHEAVRSRSESRKPQSGWDFSKDKSRQPLEGAPLRTSLEEAVPPDCRHRGSREMTILQSEKDSQLMESVKDNLLSYHREAERKYRSSIEEEAEKLSARHAALHKKRLAGAKNPQGSTYVSPFSAREEHAGNADVAPSQGPFGFAACQGPFDAASKSTYAGPFSSYQT